MKYFQNRMTSYKNLFSYEKISQKKLISCSQLKLHQLRSSKTLQLNSAQALISSLSRLITEWKNTARSCKRKCSDWTSGGGSSPRGWPFFAHLLNDKTFFNITPIYKYIIYKLYIKKLSK